MGYDLSVEVNDEEVYCLESECFCNRDNILDDLTDSLWDDFDLEEYVCNNYETSDLWTAIRDDDASRFYEKVYEEGRDKCRDDAWELWRDSYVDEEDARFDCYGEAYLTCVNYRLTLTL